MKRNLSDYFVALFVIVCSVVLLGALTFALTGRQLKKPTRTLQINYEDVTGIKVNSEVRYAGAPAGRVIAMRHLTAKEREATANKKDAVRVTVSLDEGIPPLPSDVTATLSSDTMLSPKFVALSAGTPGGQTLANNASIEGHPAYGLEQITAAAGPLFDNANKLLNNLDTTVTGLKKDLGEFTPKLGPLADSLKDGRGPYTKRDHKPRWPREGCGLSAWNSRQLHQHDGQTTQRTIETTARHAFEPESGHHVR